MAEITAAIKSGSSVDDVLVEEALASVDSIGLVSVARDLHDRGLALEPGYTEALADLVAALDDLPTATAGSLYLGFLASMYLLRERNQPRLPPRSPVASLLFERQQEPFAAQAIQAINRRFESIRPWPLYLPSVERPLLDAHLDHVPETDGEVVLDRLRIAGQELLTQVQGTAELRLSGAFPGRVELHGREVVEWACRLFAVPWAQVIPTDDLERIYRVAPMSGFRSPDSVYIENERVS